MSEYLRTRNSPRIPSFWGPFTLGVALIVVSSFSEPFWQNFYVLTCDSQGLGSPNGAGTLMKAGAWGICTRYANNTVVSGPDTFCTSKMSGYELKFALNSTAGGINQFPLVQDDDTLLGLNTPGAIPVLSSGATSTLWIHVITAIVGVMGVASLILPPSALGSERSFFHKVQKSGLVTITLAFITFILGIVSFVLEIIIIIPARNRLGAVDGITCKLGNIQWFILPGSLVMLPAFASMLIKPRKHEFQQL